VKPQTSLQYSQRQTTGPYPGTAELIQPAIISSVKLYFNKRFVIPFKAGFSNELFPLRFPVKGCRTFKLDILENVYRPGLLTF
jgi:hypothetical protein